jgi:hypothetical protein
MRTYTNSLARIQIALTLTRFAGVQRLRDKGAKAATSEVLEYLPGGFLITAQL